MSDELKQEDRIEMVGFPKFWDTAHAEKPEAFKAINELVSLQNRLFEKPVGEPLHRVVRHLTKIGANSVSALTTLLLNGYGPDAMSIARGILEKSIVVAFLIKHPDKLDDYLDYQYITNKRKMDQYDKRYPEYAAEKMSSTRRQQIEADYAKVEKRFRKGKNVRYSWSELSVFKMVTDVDMADHYHIIYSEASGIQHGDINGLAAYMTDDFNDIQIAPSSRWIVTALFAGHRGLLSLITHYNDLAQHGFNAELDAAREVFKKTWVKEKDQPI